MNTKLNIIFLGEFPYPKGMAGTKRIQHAIDALKKNSATAIRVIVLRQSSRQNNLSGTHGSIPYETIVADIQRLKLLMFLPILNIKAILSLKRALRPNANNIIYKYEPPNLVDILILFAGKLMGYKIVFDIVEDYDLAWNISSSIFHRLKMASIAYLTGRIKYLASGIIVISSHLQDKYSKLVDGNIPLHFRPISIDSSWFPDENMNTTNSVKLFYSGSFGEKDGIPVLLDAFDGIAAKFDNIHLVMTGRGELEKEKELLERIAISPFKNRIEFMGYLDDETYYHVLNEIDIPCMVRINTDYAQAGFPFKLGEFLATGKPVVASRVSDVGKLFNNNEEIFLVTPGDSTEIISAINYIVTHPKEAAIIGKSGRGKAKKMFDYRTQGKLLFEFLTSL